MTPLREDLKSLDELYANNFLTINCTGLGARTLFDDLKVYPLRGQVLSSPNPGIKRAIADEAGPTYIIPRSNDCILGGTNQRNRRSEKEDRKDSRDTLRGCLQLDPKLNVLGRQDMKVGVGLRPERDTIRLERVRVTDKCAVIHNSGHGGAGFTVSWGCADRVVELAKQDNHL